MCIFIFWFSRVPRRVKRWFRLRVSKRKNDRYENQNPPQYQSAMLGFRNSFRRNPVCFGVCHTAVPKFDCRVNGKEGRRSYQRRIDNNQQYVVRPISDIADFAVDSGVGR